MEVKISVVVPAFNEEKLLAGSLQSIKAAAISFQKAGIDHELIVCDNNSSDRTAEIARKEGAAVIFEPHNQIAKARNTGASIATGTGSFLWTPIHIPLPNYLQTWSRQSGKAMSLVEVASSVSTGNDHCSSFSSRGGTSSAGLKS